ncbi:MAG: coproporphyrinogen III oxidase [Planctomycetes bacterium]|nr:coproporphyrinogen III oxidase [Planctomycetota bacterium]
METREPETESLEGSYFVSTYPPFSLWTPGQLDAWRGVLSRPPARDEPLGVYVHVPFCAERCRYCYYLSHANPDDAMVDRYLSGVLAELAGHARAPALAGRPLDFVYVGGGTPSLLATDRIRRLLAGIRERIPWRDDAEVTFECAPQTATADRLAVLREEGVTRLSMGVQQLDDDVLRKNGRVHVVADVERAWPHVRAAGFDVVNVDLIAGLVGETDVSFYGSLDRVIDMEPESATLYLLEIPLNTPLYRALRNDSATEKPPAWPTKRGRLSAAFDRLENAGYSLRSAYAAVRDPDLHPFVYQESQYRGADLIGVGASAFSFVQGVHHQNATSLAGYLDRLERGEPPLGRAYALSAEERCLREFVLQLKLGGASAAAFSDRFDIDVIRRFAGPLERFAQRGWLTVDDDRVTVTREGLLHVDRMIPRFYPEDRQDVRYS